MHGGHRAKGIGGVMDVLGPAPITDDTALLGGHRSQGVGVDRHVEPYPDDWNR